MKFNSKLIMMALAALSFASCADLDTEPEGGVVTNDQKGDVVAKNPERVKASVTAITSMFSVYMNAYNGEAHCDVGYPAIMLFTDSRCADLVSEDIGYNWFTSAVEMTDRMYTNAYNAMMWKTLYNQVYSANQVASVISSDSEDNTLKFYRAQALAIRAFDYFTLIQMYQHTYATSKDKAGVPLILDTNADDAASNGAPRASVAKVYEQILADLNEAVTLLTDNSMKREDKRYVNLPVVYGLRARVNLVMQNWADAKADAEKAIELTDAQPISIAEASQPGFKDINEKDWMWGILIEETDRVVTSGIVNWPSHMGSLNYGYASVGAWRMVSKALYNQIGMTDARKGWFLDADGKSGNLTEAQQDYVTNEAGCPAYTQVKFAPYGDEIYTSTNANDIPLMRVEEMYLIKAEAEAMAGNPAAGAAALEQFVKTYRDADYVCRAASAQDVQNAVWLQRRIELWGEGFTYFDVMRLQKGVDRRGAGFQPQYVYVVEASDDNMIFQIPNSEIQANKAISDEDNNANTSVPTPVDE